jgi:hypothetical protein
MVPKYVIKIILIFFIIFSLIIFMRMFYINLNDIVIPKKLLNVITIEALQNNDKPILMKGNVSFCNNYNGYNLEMACNKLTQNNCNSTKCCIWSNENKCKSGDETGLLFNSNKNGKTIK